jgi:hypothetical protein
MKKILFFLFLFIANNSYSQNSKYQAELYAGYSIGVGYYDDMDRLTIDFVNGIRFSNQLFLGFGASADHYLNYSAFVSTEPYTTNAYSVYFNGKRYLQINQKSDFFFTGDIGYNFRSSKMDGVQGVFFTPGLGVCFKINKIGINTVLGYKYILTKPYGYQDANNSDSALTFRVGIVF